MRLLMAFSLLLVGCSAGDSPGGNGAQRDTGKSLETLVEAKRGFQTKIVSNGDTAGSPDRPGADQPFQLIQFPSPVGELSAYLTRDPGDGKSIPPSYGLRVATTIR